MKFVIGLLMMTAGFGAHAATAEEQCLQLAKIRDSIQPLKGVTDYSQEKQIGAGFVALEKAAKSLDGSASDACLDAFTTLSLRLLKSSDSLEGIESFGIYWKKHRAAAERAVGRLEARDQSYFRAKLKIFESSEEDAKILKPTSFNTTAPQKFKR